MSPRARFGGGGPQDGHEDDLPTLPDTYEVTTAGTVYVYRRQPGTRDPVVYTLESHRRASG